MGRMGRMAGAALTLHGTVFSGQIIANSKSSIPIKNRDLADSIADFKLEISKGIKSKRKIRIKNCGMQLEKQRIAYDERC